MWAKWRNLHLLSQVSEYDCNATTPPLAQQGVSCILQRLLCTYSNSIQQPPTCSPTGGPDGFNSHCSITPHSDLTYVTAGPQPKSRDTVYSSHGTLYSNYNFFQNREKFLCFNHFLHFQDKFLHYQSITRIVSILNLDYTSLFYSILSSETTFRSGTSNVMHVPCVLTKGHELQPRGSSSKSSRHMQQFSPFLQQISPF